MNPYISHVAATNLKGRSFEYDLTPLTIVAGRNFSGKTAITDAVRLALMGKLPEVGGKPGDAFALASGSRMSVSLCIAGPEATQHIERTLTQKGASVSCEPAKMDPQYYCPMLEPDAWAGMTERQFIDTVFSKCPMPEDATAAGIIARLQRISFGAEHSEAIEQAKQEQINDVDGALSQPGTLPELLVKAEADLAEDFTLWNGRARDGEGAIRTLTELKLRENECTSDTLTDLRNAVAETEVAGGEANKVIGALQARSQAAQNSKKRRAEIQQALLEAAPTPKPEPTFTPIVDIEKLAGAIKHGKELLAKEEAPDLASAQCDYDGTNEVQAGLLARYRVIASEVETMDTQLAELAEHKECPFCKSKAKGWADRVRAAIEGPLIEKRKELEAAADVLNEAGRNNDKAMGMVLSAKAKLEGRRTIEQNIADAERAIQANETAVAAHEREIEHVRAANASEKLNYHNRITALQDEFDRLEDTQAPTLDELTAANATLEKYRTVYAETKAKLRSAEALAQDTKRAVQAAEEATAAVARRDVIKRIKAELTEIKGGLVATAFGSLLETANRIVGDVLKAPLSYHEDTAQVGMWSKSGFVSHKTFSGVERLLTYIAISCALSAKAKLKVAIIDEFARLTHSAQDKVLGHLRACVEDGTLHQSIVIIPTDEQDAESEWTDWSVINVEDAK